MELDDEAGIERASAPPELNISEHEIVLLDIDGGHYYTLAGSVSVRIWRMLVEPRSLTSLVDSLVEEFDVDRERCLDETRRFLDDMLAKGLVRQTRRARA